MPRAFRIISILAYALLTAGALTSCGPDSDPSEIQDRVDRMVPILDAIPGLMPTIEVRVGRDGRVESIAELPAETVNDFVENLNRQPLGRPHRLF